MTSKPNNIDLQGTRRLSSEWSGKGQVPSKKNSTSDRRAANYQSETQNKNIAWYLPRPKPDRYKGGMPLHAEDWCLQLARDILGNQEAEILNLFCGMNKQGFRVDLNAEVEPDLVCDAHEISKHISQKFDIVFADPPYSNDEAKELYGTPKLNYKKWTSEATKVLRKGGLLIVYHKYVMPNPNPDEYHVAKRVFIGNRTYHVPRVAIYFRRSPFEFIR